MGIQRHFHRLEKEITLAIVNVTLSGASSFYQADEMVASQLANYVVFPCSEEHGQAVQLFCEVGWVILIQLFPENNWIGRNIYGLMI